jgi:hypothetical protein
MVYPIILGAGKRLCRDGATARPQPAECRPLGEDDVLPCYAAG